jgi:hypothetical protein
MRLTVGGKIHAPVVQKLDNLYTLVRGVKLNVLGPAILILARSVGKTHIFSGVFDSKMSKEATHAIRRHELSRSPGGR